MSHPGGRPPMFDNVEDFNREVEAYFEYVKGEWHWETRSDENDKPVDVKIYDRDPEPVTITGLCLHLGFESRQSYHDYAKKSEFSYALKRARLRVENYYESSAQFAKNPTAHIFALKNLGWSDRQEIDHQSSDGSMSPTKIVFGSGDQAK